MFVQNKSNNFMYACDDALLILYVTLKMTLIHCGLRLHTLFTQYLRDDKNNALSIFMLSGSIQLSLPFQFKSSHAIFLNHAFGSF